MIHLIFIVLLIFLSSCVGIRNAIETQLVPIDVSSMPNRNFKRNLSHKDIDYAIVNKDFARAASILTQLDGLDEPTQQKYITVIKEGFGDLFLETMENQGILAALPYYFSLQSLGAAETYISQSTFAEKLFDYYIAKEYFGAALNFAQTSLQNGMGLEGKAQVKFQSFIQKQFANNPSNPNVNFWEQRLGGTVTIFVKLGTQPIPYTQLYLPSIEVGSGFFIDNSGSIITNYHVVNQEPNSQNIFVKLSSRDELIPARLVGWDPSRDLALLRISRPAPYLLRLSSTFNLLQYKSADRKPNPALFVGDELYAIGAPGGLENTLTSGRVSARGRKILPLSEVLQVDVPANPGNSGGPLLNSQGVIEGIVFARNDSGFEGIAFAIPSDTLSSIIPRLYLGGEVQNSWLGLLVDQYSNSEDYLEIRYIFPNSPAASLHLSRVCALNLTATIVTPRYNPCKTRFPMVLPIPSATSRCATQKVAKSAKYFSNYRSDRTDPCTRIWSKKVPPNCFTHFLEHSCRLQRAKTILMKSRPSCLIPRSAN